MGTAQRRQREARQRRQSILAAAREVFWRRGYAGTTMPQIASEAELAPGTLYLYFPGKDALYAELLVEGYALLLDRLQRQAQREAPPRQVAAGLIDAFFGFARDFPEYFGIIFFLIQREDAGGWESRFDPDQLQRLRTQEKLCKDVAAEVLRKAGAWADEQAAPAVEAIWAMLAGVVFYFRRDEAFDQIAKQSMELILKAVFGSDSC